MYGFCTNCSEPRTPIKFQVGEKASLTLWLNLSLQQPLVLDGATLLLGELTDLRRRRRVGGDLSWLAPAGEVESPMATSPRSSTASRNSMWTEELEGSDCLQWKLGTSLTLKPGVNEVEFAAPVLPPPGTYIVERLVMLWGSLVLEQDQLMALDSDTLDVVVRRRQPPRRFSALSRSPAKKAVSLSVQARPLTCTIDVVACPVLPPDARGGDGHQLSVVVETRTDSVTNPTLIVNQSPLGLAFIGPAIVAYFEPGE